MEGHVELHDIFPNIPTTPNNSLSCVERHKFEAALQVSTGPKRNEAFF